MTNGARLHAGVFKVGDEQRQNRGVVQFWRLIVSGRDARRQNRGVVQFWGQAAPKCIDEAESYNACTQGFLRLGVNNVRRGVVQFLGTDGVRPHTGVFKVGDEQR